MLAWPHRQAQNSGRRGDRSSVWRATRWRTRASSRRRLSAGRRRGSRPPVAILGARRCRRRRCPSCRSSRRPSALRPAHPRRRCLTRRPASGSCPARRHGPACRMRRLAPVPDRQAGPRLQPRSPRFSLASSMSPGLGDDERFGLLHAPFAPELLVAGSLVEANGALAMQAARCGDRAGISGSFCECFATDRPHMRRWNLHRTRDRKRCRFVLP